MTHTSLFSKVASLYPKNWLPPPHEAQIALRFPKVGKKVPLPQHVWHCDRMGNPNAFGNFSLLVGVVLSDTPESHMGQFCLFPGSHKAIGEEVRVSHEVWCKKQKTDDKMKFDNGVMLEARVGDAIIAHPFLAHRGGPNFSPNIRYNCYFRLTTRNHGKKKMRQNMWYNVMDMKEKWEDEVEERINRKRSRGEEIVQAAEADKKRQKTSTEI